MGISLKFCKKQGNRLSDPLAAVKNFRGWLLLAPPGYPWFPLAPPGSLVGSTFKETEESSPKPLGIPGSQEEPGGAGENNGESGTSWLLLATPGLSRLFLAPAFSWLPLAPPVSPWLLLAPLASPGSSWLSLAPPGSLWLLLAPEEIPSASEEVPCFRIPRGPMAPWDPLLCH